ncbi:MAG: ferric reductase-like transmembrane domain-containing protein [Microlunatus sp.]|nr:ferric reductase-like transmembrane domain-containing protein [Microlunatus sp.]
MWGGMLLVGYWWIADRGVQDLAGWASGLTSLGRIAGLFAAQLLLVQVLLMSRLPVLERAYGRVRLARVHRVVGLWSFWLMITHIVTIVGGYASAGWSLVPGTLWQLLTGYGGVLLAAAGTVCLIMVVATSIKTSRRRLRYESWHLLHLYERGLRVYYLGGRRPHPWSVLGPLPPGLDELDALLGVVPDLAEYDVFLCGPDEWTRGMTRLMSAGGVPAEHVHTESFAW